MTRKMVVKRLELRSCFKSAKEREKEVSKTGMREMQSAPTSLTLVLVMVMVRVKKKKSGAAVSATNTAQRRRQSQNQRRKLKSAVPANAASKPKSAAQVGGSGAPVKGAVQAGRSGAPVEDGPVPEDEAGVVGNEAQVADGKAQADGGAQVDGKVQADGAEAPAAKEEAPVAGGELQADGAVPGEETIVTAAVDEQNSVKTYHCLIALLECWQIYLLIPK